MADDLVLAFEPPSVRDIDQLRPTPSVVGQEALISRIRQNTVRRFVTVAALDD
jgi:hypothetical protein